MKNVLSVAISLMVAAMIVGCGGGEQQPAKTEKPAEPAFVAKTMSVPAMRVASLAKVGSYDGFDKAQAELFGLLQKEKLAPGMPIGVYYDDPAKVKPESCRYEVWMQVPAETKIKADKKTGFAIKDAPEMAVAATDYMGPYDGIDSHYPKLFEWIGKNQLVLVGPTIEWYLNDPSKVKPESLLTRIGAVVKPAAPPADTTK